MRILRPALPLAFWLAFAPSIAQAQGSPTSDPYWTSSGTWGQPYRDKWGLEPTRRLDAGARARRPRVSTIVAVIDTGLDYFHPSLPRGSGSSTRCARR